MKKNPKNFNIKALVLSSLVTIGMISYLSWGGEEKTLATKESREPAFYPKQYSDDHITANAIVTDPKYKNLATVRSDAMLANVVSSFQTSSGGVASSEMEKGTWLWTPILDQTSAYQQKIIAQSKRNGIKNIYLSIDSYLDIYIMADGEEKASRKKQFDQKVSDFISLAEKNGMTVDAEAGWRNWSEPGNSYKAFAILDYAIKFNRSHTEKLRGLQLDVEPYLLPAYKDNKAKVLFNFVNFIDETVARLDKSDLSLSVVIPEFYDGENDMTPKFTYNGQKNYAISHLLRVLDKREGSKIIVMSYRNKSEGKDGAIEISKGEISVAEKFKTKIVLAEETGDVEPPYITFHNTSKSYYLKQVSLLEKAFSKNKSYNGIAIHYVNSFLDLK